MIDLVALSLLSVFVCCTTAPPLSNSDHLGLHLRLHWRPPSQQYKSSSTRVLWRHQFADWEKANCLLDLVNRDAVIDATDINKAWSNWGETFLSIMGECIPQVTLPSNRINRSWLSKELLQAMRKRKTLYRQAKSTENFSDYKRQRNKVVSQLIGLLRKPFFHKINLSSPQNF